MHVALVVGALWGLTSWLGTVSVRFVPVLLVSHAPWHGEAWLFICSLAGGLWSSLQHWLLKLQNCTCCESESLGWPEDEPGTLLSYHKSTSQWKNDRSVQVLK